MACDHCITTSLPDATLPTVALADAQVWAAQMHELADLGLRHVTFTGGEPTLALAALECLARSASAAGIATSLVTAATWARSDAQIARVVGRLGPLITTWDIGHDAFHARHLPLERLAAALEALVASGARVVVRYAARADGADADYLAAVRAAAGDRVGVMVQPVHALGRATPDLCERNPAALAVPCLSTGLFVREDGSTGPCCAGLGYGARGAHPFDYGNVTEVGIAEAWRRWRDDQLLRLQRLVGLRPLLAALPHSAGAVGAANHVCEACTRLWQDEPGAAERARHWSASEVRREILDDVERSVHGSVWEPARAGEHCGGLER